MFRTYPYNNGMKKLGAQELRTTVPTPEELARIKTHPIYIMLDNVLDTYNVGAIFRLADAVAAEKVFLCGETETPPNSRIKKASINTTEWVPWKYCKTAAEAIQKVKIQNSLLRQGFDRQTKLKTVAIEQDKESIPYDQADYQFPLALVVGNETYGVSREVLEMCDQIVEIPMWGINKSLNVMVSLGIVLFEALKTKEDGK